MRKKLGIVIGLFCVLALNWVAGHSAGDAFLVEQALNLTLEQDLSIGVEDGDENFIFGNISRIALDGRGNIYVLDYKFHVIRIFDKDGAFLRAIDVPSGQGPTESVNPSGLAVTPGGTLFINDRLRLIVYGADGIHLRTFNTGFRISCVGCIGTEECLAIGPNNGKILHIFDETGKCLESFGEYFPVPPELKQMTGMPMFSAPLIFNSGSDGRIFVLSPYKYEITVFKDRKVEEILQGKNKSYTPLTQKGRAFVITAANIVRTGDLILVLLSNPDPNAPKILDVFRGGSQVGVLKSAGIPHAVDSLGRIYFADNGEVPKVIRCSLIKN
ncbi:6-bladed beta-propeller [Acidobacteriota bacterium]